MKKIKLRSKEWFDNPKDPGLTALYLERYLNYGLKRKDLQSGKPIIGICNGFQVLVKTGLLPGPDTNEPDFIQRASLTLNDSGRYEDRWVTLEFNQDSNCIWTKGMTQIDCPVRHGEGKYVMPDRESLAKLSANNQITVRYVDPNNQSNQDNDEVLPFPKSPNGSMMNIAGISDKTGLVFGLMPHPEAIYAQWLHPDFSRGTLQQPFVIRPCDQTEQIPRGF